MERRRPSGVCAAVCAAMFVSAHAFAADEFRVTQADVTVTCPLTIGGTFDARTSAVSGNVTPDGSGVIRGALAVDLTTLATGVALRDRQLRNNYLEVRRGDAFARARMENIRLGTLSGRSPFTATLLLHGQQRDISGTAEVSRDATGYKVDATFPLKLSAFDIPGPTYLGVGVTDDVTVRVVLTTSPAAPRVATTGLALNR